VRGTKTDVPKPKKNRAPANATSANVGYEAELWQMADALRGSMDAAEYKHVVLGLIFLKYISDAFEELYGKLVAEKAQGADPEDPDEYRGAAHPVFWVPPEARWPHLKAQARQSTIGQLVDDAMAGIERDNPALKGVLPKDYARPALDKQRLGQLIDLVSNIRIGDAEARAKDVLGRVYQPVGRGRDPQEPRRGGPRGLHGGVAGPALLLDADPGVPVVPRARPQERQASSSQAGPSARPASGQVRSAPAFGRCDSSTWRVRSRARRRSRCAGRGGPRKRRSGSNRRAPWRSSVSRLHLAEQESHHASGRTQAGINSSRLSHGDWTKERRTDLPRVVRRSV
jgi:hypothetical protein